MTMNEQRLTKQSAQQRGRKLSHQSIGYAGLVVAAAFGDIRKLWRQPNQPATAKPTVSRSTDKKTGEGHTEGSFPSPGTEWKDRKIRNSATFKTKSSVRDIAVGDTITRSTVSRPLWATPVRCVGTRRVRARASRF